MAIFNGTIYSNTLAMETDITVILPTIKNKSPIKKPKDVLYLLHGITDNHTKWLRMSNVEEYANNFGVAVIMPDAGRSFYCDMAYGVKYFTFIAKELPEICQALFNIPTEREHKFVAGLSMGGYGAFKCGFTFPEDFAGCGSFSGALDIKLINEMTFNDENLQRESYGIIGDSPKQNDDLFFLSTTANQTYKSLKVFQSCGLEDYLYPSNVKFKNHMENLKFNYNYMEWHGEHNWEFWRASLKHLFEFFF